MSGTDGPNRGGVFLTHPETQNLELVCVRCDFSEDDPEDASWIEHERQTCEHAGRVGKTIVETVPTQILFPNDRATISDYDFLRVNAKEAALLVQPTIGQRIALVRSAGDSVFVDADLSALGDLLPILGGGATGEARVPADWRANPDFWRHLI